MHGTRVYLPVKVNFFLTMSIEMEADVIVFAYRGFGLSDGNDAPNEEGIMKDIDAITAFFANQVEKKGGNERVEPILWGRSFGAAPALISHLKLPKLTEALIIESPFTSVPDVYRSFFPYCYIG